MMHRCLYLSSLGILFCCVATAQTGDDKDKPPSGFEPIFNGKDLTGWKILPGGNINTWGVEKGILFVKGGASWLMTEKEYSDFEIRLEFKTSEKSNSGVALRAPFKGNPGNDGMEIQILDDEGYKNLQVNEQTGSIWHVVGPTQKATKARGEWQAMQITAKGPQVTVVLNGTKILDANLDDYIKSHSQKHPGLRRDKGHLGLQGYGGRTDFRRLYVKRL